MSGSYEDIMGEPMDVDTHPARQMPPATQSYAGDVLPIAGERSMGGGEDSRAASYATGQAKDPKVIPMPMSNNSAWAKRTMDRRK